MPRLFANLGRSSKEHARAYNGYEGYDAPHGYVDDYGYEEQSPQPSSAWRKVFPRKLSRKNYVRPDQIPYSHTQQYRSDVVEDYPAVHPHAGMLPTDDDSSFENLFPDSRHHAPDATVPLVQRESSLARIGNAFADHGAFVPSAVPSTSHGAPFYAPQPIPAGQPHVTTMNGVHSPPIVVPNPIIPQQAVRADIVHHSASYPPRSERQNHRRRERERSEPPRMTPSRDHPAYWDKPLDPHEEPPVVVVVEHGKNGKKDKYYIIPGGAPVIFEDEDGNELTRVGDFSGRYRPPQRPRPVIVQDQYGREICRAGFNNDDRVSVGSRSLDDYSYHSESGRSHHRGRSSHRTAQAHDAREHREQDARHSSRHGTHHNTYHSSGHGSQQGSHHTSHRSSPHASSRQHVAPDSYLRDPHYQPSRARAGSRSAQEDIVFVDPRAPRSERSAGSTNDTLVRATSPRHVDDRRGRSRPDYVPTERDQSHRREYRRESSSLSGSSRDSYDPATDRHHAEYE